MPVSPATWTDQAPPHNPVLVLATPGYTGQKPLREGAATSKTSAGESPERVWSHLIDLIGCHVTAVASRCPACALLTCHAFLLMRNRHRRCIPFCMSPRPSLLREAAMQLENTSYFINLQPPPRQTIISSSPNDSSWLAFCRPAALYLSSPA